MKGYLHDSNSLLEIRRRNPDPIFLQNVSLIDPEEAYLSVINFYELRYGVAKKKLTDPLAARNLAKWVDGLNVAYEKRIYPLTQEIAERAALISPAQRPPLADCFLAATALIHDLCVVTRNVRDFARSGVAYLNPFETPIRIQN
jgi:predicted nucleic acid-binding protein